MGPILLCRVRFIKTKIIQKKTLTTLPIKEVDQEQQRLIWLNYTNFVKEGANLNPEAKEKVLKSMVN
jgi:peptidyl-dipeptidase Dcp